MPVLRVGTSGDYSPFSTVDEASPQRRGFDIEVAEILATDLGMTVEWVPFEWPQLQEAVANDRFDIAMSGVTWRPSRAVLGRMTQSVASGGPCLLGEPAAHTLGVNRGGALEAWAKRALPERELVTTDNNLELPRLLVAGAVGAIVTDSFELASFQRASAQSVTWKSKCEPSTWRKVYWLAPGSVERLGRRVGDWLVMNEPRLRRLRQRWFGDEQVLTQFDRLVELLSRRLALMPHVAAYKQEQALPIEDLEREAQILKGVERKAEEHELNRASLGVLFQLQMDLAKAVQRRATVVPSLELRTQLRPVLSRLGTRISTELARLAKTETLQSLEVGDLQSLQSWLEPDELMRLAQALRGPWAP